VETNPQARIGHYQMHITEIRNQIIDAAYADDPSAHIWKKAWSDLLKLYGLDRWPCNLYEPWLAAALLAPVCYWLVLRMGTPAQSIQWGSETGLFFFSVILWQPFVEELCFRGVLQGMLLERTKHQPVLRPLTLANLFTGTLFALAHLLTHTWLWALGIFWVSLLFGYARERTRSLYPAVFLHSYCNAGYFLLLAF